MESIVATVLAVFVLFETNVLYKGSKANLTLPQESISNMTYEVKEKILVQPRGEVKQYV